MSCLCSFVRQSNATKFPVALSTNILEALVDYLYRTNFPMDIVDQLGLEGVIDLLRAADQFLMPNLVRDVEVVIAEYVTVRNVAEIYRVATAFNANQLKTFCMELITCNVALLLENRYDRVFIL